MGRTNDERIREAIELLKQGKLDEVRGMKYSPYRTPPFVIIEDEDDLEEDIVSLNDIKNDTEETEFSSYQYHYTSDEE